MESIIARIKRQHFYKFEGGIHPPEQKWLTTDKPIRHLLLPEQLILPIRQHIGVPGDLLVSVGDHVLKGQPLTQAHHPMAVPIHAPTSGTVTEIKNATVAHPSGLSEQCLFITPDGQDQWCARSICHDYSHFSHEQIVSKIMAAGIAGMGGAGFPTHIKVNAKAPLKYLIINAAECEPYITADDLLIREQCATICDGIAILAQLLKPAMILIGIEDNKPEAIKALQQACKAYNNFYVCVLPTKYPTGGEKQLIKALTGQEVPRGGLPLNLGIVVQNIASCYAVANAIIYDTPLIERVVTVSGQALQKPQNVWALLGTPVHHLLKQCGYRPGAHRHLIMGGPMMGFSLPSDNVPVIKTTNCILAPSEQEISADNKEVECIRCGQCADVCPSLLLPQELQWYAKAKDFEQLNKLNLFDCIECGACAYVCPSQIPLVHYYRIAKADVRQQQLLELKAEKAKQRFEARKERLENDRIKREEKHRQAAEARRATMSNNTPEAQSAKSAVAAALARAKAKKAQATDGSQSATTTTADMPANQADIHETAATGIAKSAQLPSHDSKAAVADKKSQVSAAIARAKAKKLANQAAQANIDVTTDNTANKKAEAENFDGEPSTGQQIAGKPSQTVTVTISRDIASNSNTGQLKHSDVEPAQTAVVTAVNTTAADGSATMITGEQPADEQARMRAEKIKAAIRKAKAKANGKTPEQTANVLPVANVDTVTAPTNEQADTGLTAVAANGTATDAQADTEADDATEAQRRKAQRIAEVIAKAKAKKQQNQLESK